MNNEHCAVATIDPKLLPNISTTSSHAKAIILHFRTNALAGRRWKFSSRLTVVGHHRFISFRLPPPFHRDWHHGALDRHSQQQRGKPIKMGALEFHSIIANRQQQQERACGVGVESGVNFLTPLMHLQLLQPSIGVYIQRRGKIIGTYHISFFKNCPNRCNFFWGSPKILKFWLIVD